MQSSVSIICFPMLKKFVSFAKWRDCINLEWRLGKNFPPLPVVNTFSNKEKKIHICFFRDETTPLVHRAVITTYSSVVHTLLCFFSVHVTSTDFTYSVFDEFSCQILSLVVLDVPVPNSMCVQNEPPEPGAARLCTRWFT